MPSTPSSPPESFSGRIFPVGDPDPCGYRIDRHEGPAREIDAGIPPGWLAVLLCLSGAVEHLEGRRAQAVPGGWRWCPPVTAATARLRLTGPGPHRLVVIAWDPLWLVRRVGAQAAALKPFAAAACGVRAAGRVRRDAPEPLTAHHLHQADLLRQPSVPQSALPLWYEARALGWAATCLFAADDHLFCHRRQRADRERVDRCLAILRQEFSEPLVLESLARRVGVSPFHLSRTFARVTGETLQRHARRLRVEHAARLIRAGTHNVTEAAFAVGYSSLGHFASAFRQVFRTTPSRFARGEAGPPTLDPGRER